MFQLPESCRSGPTVRRNRRSDVPGANPLSAPKRCGQVSPGRRGSELRMARRISRRAKVGRAIRRVEIGALPDFVPPQLTALTESAPEGGEWAHELKWDGYRMHARIEARNVRLLTRTGLDWTDKYPSIVKALRALSVSQAYLDGELCALSEQGLTSFSAMQAATDTRSIDG